MSAPRTPEQMLDVIENAAGILRLRLSDSEQARQQGARMVAQATDRQLVAMILTSCASLLEEVEQ